MKQPVWILDELVTALHAMLIAEHGGDSGIRDAGLLAAALARPQQKLAYAKSLGLFQLAAAYSFDIARNHAFVDGNKRTAFTVGVLFLEMNGYRMHAAEAEAAVIFAELASGKLTETELAQWFENNCKKHRRSTAPK